MKKIELECPVGKIPDYEQDDDFAKFLKTANEIVLKWPQWKQVVLK